jgi:chromosome segregation ATPase
MSDSAPIPLPEAASKVLTRDMFEWTLSDALNDAASAAHDLHIGGRNDEDRNALLAHDAALRAELAKVTANLAAAVNTSSEIDAAHWREKARADVAEVERLNKENARWFMSETEETQKWADKVAAIQERLDACEGENDTLEKEVERLNGCAAALTHEFVTARRLALRLRSLIETRPHDKKCRWLWDGPRGIRRQGDLPCDCWKAGADEKELS